MRSGAIDETSVALTPFSAAVWSAPDVPATKVTMYGAAVASDEDELVASLEVAVVPLSVWPRFASGPESPNAPAAMRPPTLNARQAKVEFLHDTCRLNRFFLATSGPPS